MGLGWNEIEGLIFRVFRPFVLCTAIAVIVVPKNQSVHLRLKYSPVYEYVFLILIQLTGILFIVLSFMCYQR